MRVDDLLVEKVAREAEGIGWERRLGGGVEPAPEPEVPDLHGEIAPFDDLLAARRREDGPLSRRELTLWHQCDVGELSHLVAVRLDHPAVLDFRQVRHERQG